MTPIFQGLTFSGFNEEGQNNQRKLWMIMFEIFISRSLGAERAEMNILICMILLWRSFNAVTIVK